MIVYGSREQQADPGDLARRLGATATLVAPPGKGIERHAALAGLLIAAGQIAQGLADADFARRRCDQPSASQIAAMDLVRDLARRLLASWDHGFGDHPVFDPLSVERLLRLRMPPAISIRIPEGYAWYAVYPEAFALAARQCVWSSPPLVVGLRSIGTSLAACVAEALGSPAALTLRPFGPPFDRRVRPGPGLRRRLHAVASGLFAVVDEGPGLSGSSLLGTAEALMAAGARPADITLLTSHGGSPGPMASPQRVALWASLRRNSVSFDQLSLRAREPVHRLESWFADVAGPPVEPLADLSGGRWRAALSVPDLPADAPRERRKFLLAATNGRFRLKFAGLGEIGEAKFKRSRELHRAGFAPEPLALRYGFLLEPWLDGARPLSEVTYPRPALLARLAAYIAFRARAFPAEPGDGASMAELSEMARVNLAECAPSQPDVWLPVRPPHEPDRRIRTDNRLHLFEWMVLPDGRLLKTDAVDHEEGHDLIGCQEVAWDLAGAAVEFALSAAEIAGLAAAVQNAGAAPVEAARLSFHRRCYCAFQLGLWTSALEAAPEADRLPIVRLIARYRCALSVDPG